MIFYRGEPVPVLNPDSLQFAASVGAGDIYVIMTEREWNELGKFRAGLPAPLLTSKATGPENDGRLVLVSAKKPG